MKPLHLLLAAATVTLASCAQTPHAPAKTDIAAAVASPDRPAADTQRDALRKPAELIAFAGLKNGDRVADIMPGGGYFTRIFSKVVGPDGRVYAMVPAEIVEKSAKAPDAVRAIAAQPAYANVSALTPPLAALAAPQRLDLAWTSDNYHDLYGMFGADGTAAMDAAVFKALKPGGVFIVIDHAAKPGTSDTSPKTLHRIDPATVKAQAQAAGFQLEAESQLLANPADPRDAAIFTAAIRGHTDQFVLKFRKPLN
jgi:predicted methyltransferase